MTPEDRYLDLVERSLTRTLGRGYQLVIPPGGRLSRPAYRLLQRGLGRRGLTIVRYADPALREDGRDWPLDAETMVGVRRLANLRACVERLVDDGVAGDLFEAGVWRGGAAIMMKAVLVARGDDTRDVWLADSFQGLPKPDEEQYPADRGSTMWSDVEFAVSVEEVRASFERYGLLDERVRFLPGWFRDTLPTAPVERLALLRLDGDLYESTMVALESLYDRVSPGGFVIVDDYGAVEGCRIAVDEFRDARGIDEPLTEIDWTGVFWRRGGDG